MTLETDINHDDFVLVENESDNSHREDPLTSDSVATSQAEAAQAVASAEASAPAAPVVEKPADDVTFVFKRADVVCKLTDKIFRHPVRLIDGFMVELNALREHIVKHGNTSPRPGADEQLRLDDIQHHTGLDWLLNHHLPDALNAERHADYNIQECWEELCCAFKQNAATERRRAALSQSTRSDGASLLQAFSKFASSVAASAADLFLEPEDEATRSAAPSVSGRPTG